MGPVAGAREREAAQAGTPGARKHRLVVAVRPGDALGFRLAGAEVVPVEPGGEGGAMKAILADPTAAVLAVEEGVLAAVPERLVRRARDRGVPVILPFALPQRWSDVGRGRAYVAAIIRRAVGYGVKLGGAGGEP